jgi:hypothetical protein
MKNFICTTCGVQHGKSINPPNLCAICKDERQYVNSKGQSWTTLEQMKRKHLYKNEISDEEHGLHSIKTVPEFAIGQTAYLVKNKGFNLLWDCITYLDSETINRIGKLGGIDAIALSHPHYYSTQIEWAEAFDVPIYIHDDDKEWIMRQSEKIVFWTGEAWNLGEGLTLLRLGGHYKGGAVLHWQAGDNGKGVLLTGDIIQVVADQQWVSFMYSYPNLIPLPSSKVQQIANQVKDLPFNRIYNAFHRIVKENANESVQASAERYIKALNGDLFET